MVTFTYTIKDAVGIHARPAGLLVKQAGKFESAVKISRGDKSADGKKLFALMGLGVKCGDEIRVECDGVDEQACAESLKGFLEVNL